MAIEEVDMDGSDWEKVDMDGSDWEELDMDGSDREEWRLIKSIEGCWFWSVHKDVTEGR
jgi:hypothetical protein